LKLRSKRQYSEPWRDCCYRTHPPTPGCLPRSLYSRSEERGVLDIQRCIVIDFSSLSTRDDGCAAETAPSLSDSVLREERELKSNPLATKKTATANGIYSLFIFSKIVPIVYTIIMTTKPQEVPTKNGITLNNAQKTAAYADYGPLLIVAGAGTGQNKTLTERMLYFIEQGIKPERICAKLHQQGRQGNGTAGKPRWPIFRHFSCLGGENPAKRVPESRSEPNFAILTITTLLILLKKAVKSVCPIKER